MFVDITVDIQPRKKQFTIGSLKGKVLHQTTLTHCTKICVTSDKLYPLSIFSITNSGKPNLHTEEGGAKRLLKMYTVNVLKLRTKLINLSSF